ncbi:MAG: cadherin-like domain-containing protein [Pirellulaceae bacterium]
MSFTVNDGDANSNTVTRDISFTAVNDAPVEASIEGTPLAYTENDGAVAITSTLAVSDVDDTNIESAVVQITGNYANGEDVLAFVDQNGITGSWNAANGTLTLTGSATKADYITALRSITYNNTSENPSAATRTVSFTVNDGDANSNTVTRDIAFTAVNDAPVESSIEGTPLAYTENDGAVAITSTLTVTDVDDTNMESAVVQITGNYANGEDVLSFVDQNGITGSWNATNGTLTLTGSASKANYEAALRSVTYANVSENPSISARTISFTVNDGDADSSTLSRNITIASVNDDPTNAGSLVSDVTVTEDVSTTIDLSAIDFSDVDAASSSLTVTLSTSTGGHLAAAAGSGITIGGGPTGRTLTGTLSDLNAYFNDNTKISYLHGTPNTFGDNNDTISIVINDNGNTGSGGGGNINLGTVNVDITAVNDEQVLAVNTGTTVAEGSSGNTITTAMLETTDVDNTDSERVYTVTSVPANGTLRLSGSVRGLGSTFTQADIDAGLVTYDHNGTQTSSDSFDFTVDDGLGTTTSGTFSLTITNVNDAPVNTVPGPQTVDEDSLLLLSGISVADDDNNLSTVQLTVSNGTLNVTLSGAASISAGANGSSDLTLNGSLADINATLSSLSYQGNSHFNGSDTLTVLSTDSNAATNSDTVNIAVGAVNDTPDVVGPGSAYAVNEQTNLNIHGTGFSVTDVDAASGTVTATITVGEGIVTVAAGDSGVTIAAGNGSGNVTLTGTLAQIDNLLTGFGTGTIVYYNASDTPSASTTITVTVNDGGNTGTDPGLTGDGATEQDSASQTIHITATNDAPVIAGGPDSVGLMETNAGLMATGTRTVTDVDTPNAVTAAVDSVSISGTGIASVPGTLDSATLQSFLSVSPTAVLDNTQTTATLTWTFHSGTEAFNFLANGETLVLTYTISATDDGGVPLSDTETITVTITGTNDGPVAISGSQSAIEDGTPVSDQVTQSDLDVSDTHTFSLISNTSEGSVTLAADGSYHFDPRSDFQDLGIGDSREVTFVYEVRDSHGASALETITITVTGTNDAPTLDNSSLFQLPDVSEDDQQPAGTSIASLLSTPSPLAVDDVDALSVKGVAIETTTGNGIWQFSLDHGNSWVDIQFVDPSQALLLRATDHIRFVPAGQTGQTALISFRAWDQTIGVAEIGSTRRPMAGRHR